MEFQIKDNRLTAYGDKGKLLVDVTFPMVGMGIVEINHVFVDESLRGQGIASKALSKLYDYLKENHLLTTLTCPYAIGWFEKNPDKKDIVVQ